MDNINNSMKLEASKVRIQSRFSGSICRNCHKIIYLGNWITLNKRDKWVHVRCGAHNIIQPQGEVSDLPAQESKLEKIKREAKEAFKRPYRAPPPQQLDKQHCPRCRKYSTEYRCKNCGHYKE